MTPLEFIGAICIGALLVFLLLFGWAAWIFRGHRGDLSGIAIRREWWHRTETPPEPYVTKAGWAMPEALPPSYVTPKLNLEPQDIQHGAKTREVEGE